MTVYHDNPAGRLHRVLQGLKEVNPSSVAVKDAWASVLNVQEPARQTDKLSRRIVRVFQLPPQISIETENLDDNDFDRQFAMRWYQPVEKMFAKTLFSTAQIAQVIGSYNEDTLASLEHCSYILHRYRPEPSPSTEDLDSILKLITEIEDEIAGSDDIDAALSEFLLEHVRAMKAAIDDFFIVGARALQERLDQAVGAAVRQPDLMANATNGNEGPESETVLHKFGALLTRIAVVLSISANLLAIGQAAHADLVNDPPKPPTIENVTIVDETPPSSPAVSPIPPELNSVTGEPDD
jgi:hypothetical protein